MFGNALSHSFIQAISIYIATLQVHYYSEALPTQHGYCVGVSRQSATGNCEWRTFPMDSPYCHRARIEEAEKVVRLVYQLRDARIEESRLWSHYWRQEHSWEV